MKTKEELLKLYKLPLHELLKEAKKYTFKEFEFCSLISARTGKCSQDCKYCAQSAHYNTQIETHPLVSIDEVIKCAKESKKNGAINFAIVTSGKTPDEVVKEFDGQGYGVFKPAVGEAVVSVLKPLQDEVARLSKEKAYIDNIIKNNGEKAHRYSFNF